VTLNLLISDDASLRAAGRGPVEMVEIKGVGHPDSICDALADAVGQQLSRYYQANFGRMLHYNVDKALLRGGVSSPRFGAGEILEPIDLYLAGRAVRSFAGKTIPIGAMVQATCTEWLTKSIHALNPNKHVRIHDLIRPGSGDLRDLFERGHAAPRANDTSFGTGYAPLSLLERSVLAAEAFLAKGLSRDQYPEVGEDTKIMGLRCGERLEMTVACAFIGQYLTSIDDYLAAKEALRKALVSHLKEVTGRDIAVVVNVGDDPQSGSVFLTVTGTSAEHGDDGEVGRGNRVNGMITPYRPMSLEAHAGKNPRTHVGRIYNFVAQRIAAAVVAEVAEAAAAECYLVGKIGAQITDPWAVDLRVEAKVGLLSKSARSLMQAIVERELGF